MNLINIFFTSFNNPLGQNLFLDYLSLLPPDLKERNKRYIRWQDRHAHLFGKLLLLKAVRAYGMEKDIWNHVQYNSYERPYLAMSELDFNISHSGNLVICAIGENARIGIDIEQHKDVNINNFRNTLTPGQWQQINAANDPVKEFYKFWTIKESVIKADGRGFLIPLDQLEVQNNLVQCDDKLWFVHELDIRNGYTASLAADQVTTSKFHYIDFHQAASSGSELYRPICNL